MADLVPSKYEIKPDANPSLSNDINVITKEILLYQDKIWNSWLEIGKRLKHVKEHDLSHGQFGKWVTEALGMNQATASRLIKAYVQFGNLTTSSKIDSGKAFEMLSLPGSIDRQQFIEQEHVIPSTGMHKTVEQMTVKELREVKKSIIEAEKETPAKQQQREDSDEHHNQNDKTEPAEGKTVSSETVQPSLITTEKATIVISPDKIDRAANDFSKDVQWLVEKYRFLCNPISAYREINEDTKKSYMDKAEKLRTFISCIAAFYGPQVPNYYIPSVGLKNESKTSH